MSTVLTREFNKSEIGSLVNNHLLEVKNNDTMHVTSPTMVNLAKDLEEKTDRDNLSNASHKTHPYTKIKL